MKRILMCLFALLIAVSLLHIAQDNRDADAVEVFGRSAGPGVDAFWGFDEADGGFSGVQLFAGEETIRTRSRPQTAQVVNIVIFRVFPDHTVREIGGHAELEPGDLVLNESLESATLEVTIPAQDCLFSMPPPAPPECSLTTISVELTWTAVGPLGRQHGSFHDRFGPCIANGGFKFTGRPAEVSGTVTSGGTDYTRGETGEGRLIEHSRDRFVGVGDCFGPPPEA